MPIVWKSGRLILRPYSGLCRDCLTLLVKSINFKNIIFVRSKFCLALCYEIFLHPLLTCCYFRTASEAKILQIKGSKVVTLSCYSCQIELLSSTEVQKVIFCASIYMQRSINIICSEWENWYFIINIPLSHTQYMDTAMSYKAICLHSSLRT
jgi:hypothetical protein